MALSNETIQSQLEAKFADQVHTFSTDSGILSFESPKEINLKVLQFLFDEPSLGFTFLTDLCAVNYPDNIGAELVVVYHLHNFTENIRLRYSVATSIAQPEIGNTVGLSSRIFEKSDLSVTIFPSGAVPLTVP